MFSMALLLLHSFSSKCTNASCPAIREEKPHQPQYLSPSVPLGAMSLDALTSETLPLEARKEQGHEKNTSKITVLGNCKLFF